MTAIALIFSYPCLCGNFSPDAIIFNFFQLAVSITIFDHYGERKINVGWVERPMSLGVGLPWD